MQCAGQSLSSLRRRDPCVGTLCTDECVAGTCLPVTVGNEVCSPDSEEVRVAAEGPGRKRTIREEWFASPPPPPPPLTDTLV